MCVRRWLWRCAAAWRRRRRATRGSTTSSPSTTGAAGIRRGGGASPDATASADIHPFLVVYALALDAASELPLRSMNCGGWEQPPVDAAVWTLDGHLVCGGFWF